MEGKPQRTLNIHFTFQKNIICNPIAISKPDRKSKLPKVVVVIKEIQLFFCYNFYCCRLINTKKYTGSLFFRSVSVRRSGLFLCN